MRLKEERERVKVRKKKDELSEGRMKGHSVVWACVHTVLTDT